MSVFDDHIVNPDPNELAYSAIEQDLEKKVEEWDEKTHRPLGIYFFDPQRIKEEKELSKIVLQYLWENLGMKIPERTKRYVNKKGEIIEFKQDDRTTSND